MNSGFEKEFSELDFLPELGRVKQSRLEEMQEVKSGNGRGFASL